MELANKWITGDGGPIILMEKALLPFWEGCDEPSTNGRIVEAESRWGLDVATDYDKACDIRDWSGVINVGNGHAFVLGTSGDSATWIPDFAPNGALIEWVCADREEELIEEARDFVDRAEFSTNVEFEFTSSPLVLFMAVEPGSSPTYDRLVCDIAPGRYSIRSGFWESERNSVIAHSFERQRRL